MPVDDVSIRRLIDQLMEFNSSTLAVFTALLQKLETDLLAAPAGALQGEVEELLRVIITVCSNSITTVLALQQQLQTEIVESYFPAQD